jgi:hypothetical protein
MFNLLLLPCCCCCCWRFGFPITAQVWMDYDNPKFSTAVLGFGGNVRATVVNGSMHNNHAGSTLLVKDAAHVTLINSIVNGSRSSTGAGAWVVGNATMDVVNSSFSRCTSDTTTEGFGGGCLSASGSAAVRIIGSRMFGCHAFYGGAVWAGDASHVTISSSEIFNNTGRNGVAIAAQMASAVVITNQSHIHHNKAEVLGGALGTSHKARVYVSNQSVVEHNYAPDYGGCALLAHASQLHVDGGAVFRHCVAGSTGGFGGGVTAWHTSRAVFNNASIVDSQAEVGGGVYARDSSSVLLQGCRLEGNRCWDCGAALHARSNASIVVNNCSVVGNIGPKGAGACATGNATLTIVNSSLEFNDALKVGGGLMVASDARFEVQHSRITGNAAAENGAGLYAHDSAVVVLKDGTLVSNNSAGAMGGGLFVSDSASVQVVPGESISVHGNSARSWGGGMRASNSDFDVGAMRHTLHDNKAAWDADISVAVSRLAVVGSSAVEGFVSRGGDLGMLPVSVAVSGAHSLPCGGVVVQAALSRLHVDHQQQLIQLLGMALSNANGTADFRLKIQQQPGQYSISFSVPAEPASVAAVNLSLQVRACLPGEVAATVDTCLECTEGWFSLTPAKRACDVCPVGANCAGSTILPQPNFWHSHWASAQVHR